MSADSHKRTFSLPPVYVSGQPNRPSTVRALHALQDAIHDGQREEIRSVLVFVANNLEAIHEDPYEKYNALLEALEEEPEDDPKPAG